MGLKMGGEALTREVFFMHCHPMKLKGTNLLNICSEYVFINVRGKLKPFRLKRGTGDILGVEEEQPERGGETDTGPRGKAQLHGCGWSSNCRR